MDYRKYNKLRNVEENEWKKNQYRVQENYSLMPSLSFTKRKNNKRMDAEMRSGGGRGVSKSNSRRVGVFYGVRFRRFAGNIL